MVNMFLEKVQKYIKDYSLCSATKPIIVGFSGGPDSVALLCVMKELGFSIIAAHCNFHLRGAESDRDMEFAKSLAKKIGVPFELIHFETEKYAAEKHISIEMAARELRYDWFAKLKKENNAEAIAVAHHSDDVVETFIINLMRSSGLHGLTGIKPKNGDIIRPLLCVSRKEILDYLEHTCQDYVIDSTNNENDYLRNKIRNIILPEMELAAPSAKKSILRTIENLQRSESLQNDTIQRWADRLITKGEDIVRIKLDELQQENNKDFILYELLRPYGGTLDIVRSVFKSGEETSGLRFLTMTHVFVKNRNELHVTCLHEETDIFHEIEINVATTSIENPVHLAFEVCDGANITIEKNVRNCYIDADKIKYPLHIRKWQKGDCFVPFGQKGTKKVSDFFINEKLSIIEKERTFILTNGDGQIIWIIGRRADNRFRITDKTNKVLHISL